MLMDFIPCFLVIIPHNLTVILGEKRTKQHVRLYHFPVCLVCLSAYFCLSVSMYFFLILWVLYTVRYVTDRKFTTKFESIDIYFSLEHLQVIVKIICFIRVWSRNNSCKEQNDGYLEEIFCILNASLSRLN